MRPLPILALSVGLACSLPDPEPHPKPPAESVADVLEGCTLDAANVYWRGYAECLHGAVQQYHEVTAARNCARTIRDMARVDHRCQ